MTAERLPFDDILPRIAELAETLSAHSDPAVVAASGELLDWIDAFHMQGIGMLVEMIREWRGEIFLDSVASHPVTGLLLNAYGLGTQSDLSAAQRAVQAAMAEVRPYLASHDGEMEVVSVVDGVVRLKPHGACDGCTGVTDTLTDRVEVSMRTHWVDFRRVEMDDPTQALHPPPGAVSAPVTVQIGRKPVAPESRS
jgi:Fe-S cluster biogenesis protein NfuA